MPQTCPKCQLEQSPDNTECPRCGIVFEHFAANTILLPSPVRRSRLEDILLPETMESNPLHVGARALTLCALTYLGIRCMADGLDGAYTGQSILHLINLPFHEAGHILFRPLGRFMASLGGSLGQLLVSLVCLVPLLLKTRDAFGAAVCLWWFGQNMIDLAPYINDARTLTLPLLGDNVGSEAPYGFHDWEFILKESGIIAYDHVLAKGAHWTGSAVIVVALMWAGVVVRQQFREMRG